MSTAENDRANEIKSCVRAETAALLRQRQNSIVRRVLAHIQASPDLTELHEVARTDEYREYLTRLLDLVAAYIADPSDRRCFQIVRERAMERFRADASPVPVSRVAALHRMVVARLLRRTYRDRPAILGRALELVELASAELDATVASAYKSARDERSRTAETKYHALFENASEAILSFTPGDGRLVEVNAQCERLLGTSRAVLLGRAFADLFVDEYRDQAHWLATQHGGANVRLEDMAVRRSDGSSIPIWLSCNWVEVEDVFIAQVIMRDVTLLRQVQRELQSHADQLEARVASRTAELQNSEERYRALFLQEKRRAQHLSLINDVQQCALVTRDIDEFLHEVAAAVQLHFRECDVTCYLCRAFEDAPPAGLSEATNRDETETGASPAPPPEQDGPDHCGDLIVAAQVGGYGMAQPIGSSHPLRQGLPGFAATNGAMLVISNDTASDERYIRAPGVHRDALAQMCVPISIEGEIAGVIAVSGGQRDIFDPRDAVALQTGATIVAAHLQASQMFREMAELKEFNEALVGTMLHSLMVVSRDGTVQIVNERLSQTLRAPRSEIINRPVAEILGSAFARHNLQRALDQVTENGTPCEIPEVRVWSRGATGSNARVEEFIFDVRMSRVFFRGQAHAVFLLINLTQRWRKTQQLQLMNEMGRFLQSSLEVNTVLRTVLTCITAGPALGFNRAFLLLLSEDGTLLKGAMALGPSSPAEASIIWREMGRRALSLQEILADNSEAETRETPLQRDILALQVPLDAAASPALAQSVHERRALKVSRAQFVAAPAINASLVAAGPAARDGAPATTASTAQQRATEALLRTRSALSQIFTAPEAVVAPLVAKTRIVGVVVADNLYSGARIEDDDVRLLETVAQQAGLTVDNALTYQALHQAQRELVSAERLVAVGEMAARVSHEIRNPLATIGGWAHSILKKPEDSEGVRRKVGIITEEVSRLEELLSDLLDMARPRELLLAPCAVNELVEHALLLAEADIKAAGVEIDRHLESDIPLAMLDRRRILQALLNTLRNGAQSMDEGGVLTVLTRFQDGSQKSLEIEVRDTGGGIPERALKQIFDPFFSTKVSGSGLGLAVTLRIIRDHGGTIDVFSNEGSGTRFIMNLPLREPPDEESATAKGLLETGATSATPEDIQRRDVEATADAPSGT